VVVNKRVQTWLVAVSTDCTMYVWQQHKKRYINDRNGWCRVGGWYNPYRMVAWVVCKHLYRIFKSEINLVVQEGNGDLFPIGLNKCCCMTTIHMDLYGSMAMIYWPLESTIYFWFFFFKFNVVRSIFI